MAGLATPEFTKAMKTLYLGPLEDQTVRAHVFLARVDKNSKDVSGNFAYVPLMSDRNPSVGMRKDTSGSGPKLPPSGRQSYNNASYYMGLHYARGSVSGAVKRASRTDAGAFARAFDAEMQGLMRSAPDDLNRQLTGMGNGRLASLAGTVQAASTVIECDSRDNFQVKIGDRVHIADITGGPGTAVVPASGALITDIVYDTDSAGAASTTKHTITLDTTTGGSVTTADDAVYYGGGATVDAENTSHGTDIFGIQALVDDGNIGADEQVVTENAEILHASHAAADTAMHTKFGGIVRSSNAFWRAKVMANPTTAGVKRPLTQSLLTQAILHAKAHGGSDRLEIYMDVSMWGTLGMLQVGGRIFNDHTETVEFGFTAINVFGNKAFFDRDLPRGAMFFLNMENIFLLTQGGYEFLDDDGKIIRNVEGGGRDAWEFALNRDAQLGANNLRGHVKLKDLESTMTIEGNLH